MLFKQAGPLLTARGEDGLSNAFLNAFFLFFIRIADIFNWLLQNIQWFLE